MTRRRDGNEFGDVVRVVHRRLMTDTPPEECATWSTRMHAELRSYADRCGFLLLQVDSSNRLSDGCIVVEARGVLRPRQDGEWPSIRKAVAEDARDRQVLAWVDAHPGEDDVTVSTGGDIRYQFDPFAQEWVEL